MVDAGKFAPLGHRGMFASRQGIGIDNFIEVANEQSLLTILIEDIVAIDNMDEILEVDNIDCFFVATGDLAQSMGHPGTAARAPGRAGGRQEGEQEDRGRGQGGRRHGARG